jgi:hypothetical protein
VFEYATTVIFSDVASTRFSSIYEFFQTFMDPYSLEYRYAFCRLGNVAKHLGRADICVTLLEQLLGDWYQKARLMCDGLDWEYCSYGSAVATVTEGQVSTLCSVLPIVYEYRPDPHDGRVDTRWQRDWYRCADGSLNADELHVRTVALRTMLESGKGA